jgi:hypothetical protein
VQPEQSVERVSDANKCEKMGTNGPLELFTPPPFGDGQMKMKMGSNTHIKFAL